MNEEICEYRLQKAIELMEQVIQDKRNFDMGSWCLLGKDAKEKLQKGKEISEQEIISCGTAACFGGWLGWSETFRAAGGKMIMPAGVPSFRRIPKFNNYYGFIAIAEYLGISRTAARLLTASVSGVDLYNVRSLAKITPRMVLKELKFIKSHGMLSNGTPAYESQQSICKRFM